MSIKEQKEHNNEIQLQIKQKPVINLDQIAISINDTQINPNLKKAFNLLKPKYDYLSENNSSLSDSSQSNEVKIKTTPPTIRKYKKLSYKQVENSIDSNLNHKYSASLDILASYLKGQKIIYMESLRPVSYTHLTLPTSP
jgi:hypothetical protein